MPTPPTVALTTPSSSDHKRRQTLIALFTVEDKLRTRLGESAVQTLPESTGFSMHWNMKSGGKAIVTFLITRSGNLRVEFTKNLANGIVTPLKESSHNQPTVLLRLNAGYQLRLFNPPRFPIMYGIWNADRLRDDGEREHTIEHLMHMVDTLLVA